MLCHSFLPFTADISATPVRLINAAGVVQSVPQLRNQLACWDADSGLLKTESESVFSKSRECWPLTTTFDLVVPKNFFKYPGDDRCVKADLMIKFVQVPKPCGYVMHQHGVKAHGVVELPVRPTHPLFICCLHG